MVKPEGTFAKVLAWLSIAFLVFSILILLYGILVSLSEITLIEALNSSRFLFLSFSITPPFIYLVLGLAIAVSISAVLTFFTHDRIRMGKRGNTTWLYGKYFMIFVLIELSFSEIESYLNPSLSTSFPYDLPVASENFVLASSVLLETLLQFLVLGLILVLYHFFVDRSSDRRFLDLDIPTRQAAMISLIAAVPIAFFSGGNAIELASTFVSFAFLNIAFLRLGFLKGMSMNFSITLSNLFITLAGTSSIYSGVLTYVLLFFAILGLGAIFTFIPSSPARTSTGTGDTFEEIRKSVENHKEETVDRDSSTLLFIRSSCPSCGNANFFLNDNLDLKCVKCGHEIDRNAMGEPNISLRVARGGYRN